MSEENVSVTPEPQGGPLEGVDSAFDVIQDTLDSFLDTADVRRAYGEPISQGDRVIIPTAEVLAGLGFGTAVGSGSGEKEGQSGGGGGGGGGRAFSRPVAVIVCDPAGVEVKPIIDISKIALTALTAFGFMIATVGRMRRQVKE